MSKTALRVAEPSARYLATLERSLLRGFDLLATAPEGVARLRELILSLAVRGKLVSQDLRDEPASVLLERIRAEKEKFIAAGKVKRDKPLPALGEDEKPFELPLGWEWVRFGDITNFGITTKADELDDDVWVLDLEDIEKNSSRLLQKVRYVERGSLSDKNCFSKGDVLYGKLRPYLNKVLVADEDGVCTTEILPLRCYGPFDPHFFALALKSTYFLDYVNSKSYGMKMPRLGTEDGRRAAFPLAPFAEQSRIVVRVEALMQLCDELEQRGRLEAEHHARLVATLFETLTASASAHELAENWQRIARHFDLLLDRSEAVDALEQTILQLAVRGLLVPQDSKDEPAGTLLEKIRTEKDRLIAAGKIKRDKPLPPIADDEKPFDLPEGWEWATIDAVSLVGTGTTPSRTTAEYFDPPTFPWVTSGETGKPFIAATAERVSDVALRKTNLTVYPVGTLIVAMYGQGKTRGQVSELLIEAATNQACAAIVPVLADGSLRKYIKLFFEKIYDEIREQAAGGAQPNLNVGKVKGAVIPLPPLAEQSRIVARVEELRALCAALRQRLSVARATQSRLAEALVAQAA